MEGKPAREIVVLTSAPLWSYMRRRPHHLASRMARDFRVVNVSWARKPSPKGRDEPWESRVLARWPGERLALVRLVNRARLRRLLGQFRGAIFWVSGVPWRWAVRGLGGVVYDITDQMAGFPGAKAETTAREMALLAREADLRLAVSRVLAEAYDAQYLPNAADYGHFSKALSIREPAPWPRPALGYWGALAPWVDFDLLDGLSRALPDAHLVLAGRVDPRVKHRLLSLASRPNVSYLGELPYGRLPWLLANLDLALIPFRLTPLTMAVNPIKMYEAWAGGLGVVSVPIPEALAHREDGVLLAPEPGDFPDAVREALSWGEKFLPRRLALARENSWDARYRRLKELLARTFGILLFDEN